MTRRGDEHVALCSIPPFHLSFALVSSFLQPFFQPFFSHFATSFGHFSTTFQPFFNHFSTVFQPFPSHFHPFSTHFSTIFPFIFHHFQPFSTLFNPFFNRSPIRFSIPSHPCPSFPSLIFLPPLFAALSVVDQIGCVGNRALDERVVRILESQYLTLQPQLLQEPPILLVLSRPDWSVGLRISQSWCFDPSTTDFSLSTATLKLGDMRHPR